MKRLLSALLLAVGFIGCLEQPRHCYTYIDERRCFDSEAALRADVSRRSVEHARAQEGREQAARAALEARVRARAKRLEAQPRAVTAAASAREAVNAKERQQDAAFDLQVELNEAARERGEPSRSILPEPRPPSAIRSPYR